MLERSWIVTLLTPIAICAIAQAQVAPARFSAEVTAGAPSGRLRLTAQYDAGRLKVTIGTRHHTLSPFTAPNLALQAESVKVGSRTSIAVLRTRGPEGEYAAVFGGPSGMELLAWGRTDLQGDPGERRAFAIEVSPAGANGTQRVRVGQRYEAVVPCGGPMWLGEARSIDASRAALVASPSVGDLAGAMEVEARPIDDSAPLPAVHALEPVAAIGLDATISGPSVPHALLDERMDTAWVARAGDGAVLRTAVRGAELESLELLLSEPGGSRPPLARPNAIVWIADGGVRVRARLPRSGRRVAIALPKPLRTQCLALVVEGTEPGAASAAIWELVAHTDLERRGGIEGLVAELVRGGESAGRALEALESMGGSAAPAIAARFTELGPREQRRCLGVLAKKLDDAAVNARVIAAARSGDRALSEAASYALESGGKAGRVGLRELALEAGPSGDRAATWLARDPSEVMVLLAAIDRPGGEDRPALRRALGAIGQRAPSELARALPAWLSAGPRLGARAGAALALAHIEPLRADVTRFAEQATDAAERFEDRYRLAEATATLGTSEALDMWLQRETHSAEEWMMRYAAFSALSARNPERAEQLAGAVARDASPRVRALAQPRLLQGAGRAPVERAAREDGWPLVRVAALRALATAPGSESALRGAIADPSRLVRVAAIEGLTARGDEGAWDLVEQRLAAPDEWPAVRAAAVRFASGTCRAGARAELAALARGALRPEANEDARALGLEALKALHELGGEARRDAERMAGSDEAPPGLRETYARFGTPHCTERVSP